MTLALGALVPLEVAASEIIQLPWRWRQKASKGIWNYVKWVMSLASCYTNQKVLRDAPDSDKTAQVSPMCESQEGDVSQEFNCVISLSEMPCSSALPLD